jgi:hypothetical protein
MRCLPRQWLRHLDLPDGLIFRISVKRLDEKYSASVLQKIMIIVMTFRLGKRGERVVTIVGRDAMDADALARRAARLADGEGVWAWRPSGRC